MSSKKERYDEFYLSIAVSASELSLARNARVGAVLVRGNNILSYGFNGTPSGFDNTCENYKGETLPHVLHAESNAIAKVAQSTQSSEGATLYCTLSPCTQCAKMIMQAGIKRVVFINKYRCTDGLYLLERGGVEVEQWKR